MNMPWVRWFAAVCMAVVFIGCGGEDEADESAACTRLLDSLESCVSDWCSGEAGSNAYCGCYAQSAVVEAPPGEACRCSDAASWRAFHRAVYCTEDLSPQMADALDCSGTTAQLGADVGARCG